jgi:hypothetical protein
MLLNAAPTDFGPAVQLTGWIYHFSNGAALGIMFLAMVTRPTPRVLMWSAAAWALCVEIILLLTPYYSFFKLKLDFTAFLLLTLSAHIVFGIALGWWCARRASNQFLQAHHCKPPGSSCAAHSMCTRGDALAPATPKKRATTKVASAKRRSEARRTRLPLRAVATR